jgi:hypothetical protein
MDKLTGIQLLSVAMRVEKLAGIDARSHEKSLRVISTKAFVEGMQV